MEVLRLNANLEKLSLQLVHAREQERLSLARELHDDLGQRLTLLKIKLHQLRGFLAGSDAQLMWDSADTDVTALMAQIRAISVSLRPPELDYLGLESALRQLLERQFEHAGIDCIFEYAGLPDKLAPPVELTVYRILQESIANIVRHAHATRVVVELNGGETGAELELIIRDNGVGFDAAENLAARAGAVGGAGSGLPGMRERVQLLGGSFNVDTSNGRGTRIVVSLRLSR